MAQNDYNLIKPVEGLQNVGTLNPVQGNTEKKRRQPQEQRRRSSKTQQDENRNQTPSTGEPSKNEDDRHSIDYRA